MEQVFEIAYIKNTAKYFQILILIVLSTRLMKNHGNINKTSRLRLPKLLLEEKSTKYLRIILSLYYFFISSIS